MSRRCLSAKGLSCKLLLLLIIIGLTGLINYHKIETLHLQISSVQYQIFHTDTLLTPNWTDVLVNPYSDLYVKGESKLNLRNLPRRKLGVAYGEVSTINMNTSLPLGADFSFFSDYYEDAVVIYKDYGPGCVYRLFIVNHTKYKMKYLKIVIDNREMYLTMKQLTSGSYWPFLTPITAQFNNNKAGIASFAPICYQHSIVMIYTSKIPFVEGDLLAQTSLCISDYRPCPVQIYSAVSRLRFPQGVQVPSFANLASTVQTPSGVISELKQPDDDILAEIIEVLKQPDMSGPDADENCELHCVDICPGCKQLIYEKQGAGVISAIKIQVRDSGKFSQGPLIDWTQVLITMQWDDADIPQIDRLPLGSIFGAALSLNDFNGAVVGRKNRNCSFVNHNDEVSDIHSTGYIYFPMPYWKSAKIFIEAAKFQQTTFAACYQFTVIDNTYENSNTGYFHIDQTYFGEQTDGWRQVLSLDDHWGHVVALFAFVDNIRPIPGVLDMANYPLMESDWVLYLDGARSPTMQNSGLEDYFNFCHHFRYAANTTYSLFGNFHLDPKGQTVNTAHAYRFHILDPIPFQKSIHFMSEGTKPMYFEPEKQLSYDKHWKRRISSEPSFSNLVMFYAKKSEVSLKRHTFHVADEYSKTAHAFTMLSSSDSSPVSSVSKKRYIGNTILRNTTDVSYRTFNPGDTFSFIFKNIPANKGLTLRREFYCPLRKWNERLRVVVNGYDNGEWFIPFGALSEEFCLREEDLMISLGDSMFGSVVDVHIIIHAISTLHDVAYHLLVIQ